MPKNKRSDQFWFKTSVRRPVSIPIVEYKFKKTPEQRRAKKAEDAKRDEKFRRMAQEGLRREKLTYLAVTIIMICLLVFYVIGSWEQIKALLGLTDIAVRIR